MVTYVDLREARVGRLGVAAGAWQQLAGLARELERRVGDDVAGPLRKSGWKGSAADAAFGRVELLHDEFELVAVQTRNLAAVLRSAATEFEQLQKNLEAAIDAAVMLGLSVHADGAVSAPGLSLGERDDVAGQEAHRLAVQNAGIYTDLIRSIVAKATEADSKYAEALRKFGPDYEPGQEPWEYNHATQSARDAAALMGLTEDKIPAAGGDSKATAAWWQTLSDDERQILLTAYPDRIGALDGLPTVDRDQANRQALHNMLGDAANRREDLSEPRYQRLENLLDKLRNSESGPAEKRLYLLGIDNADSGKAVVAVGNPDTARNTAVLVPGVSTNLDGMGGQIDRADRLRIAGDASAGHVGSTSVIAWLGYLPPQIDETIVDVPFGDRSQQGAVSLDHFVDGLHVSHHGNPNHLTAVGHSYGSTVVGEAAGHGRHLAVDDIVTAGSPGMRVDHASDLSVGAQHIWAGGAPDDQVANATFGRALDPALGPVGSWGEHRVEDDTHNRSPHYASFGGNVYHVDTRGHSGYWDENSLSLRNQGAVIAGNYDRVRLDHGKAPS